MYTSTVHIWCLKFVLRYSQDELECSLKMTYPPFKLTGYEQLPPDV